MYKLYHIYITLSYVNTTKHDKIIGFSDKNVKNRIIKYTYIYLDRCAHICVCACAQAIFKLFERKICH